MQDLVVHKDNTVKYTKVAVFKNLQIWLAVPALLEGRIWKTPSKTKPHISHYIHSVQDNIKSIQIMANITTGAGRHGQGGTTPKKRQKLVKYIILYLNKLPCVATIHRATVKGSGIAKEKRPWPQFHQRKIISRGKGTKKAKFSYSLH